MYYDERDLDLLLNASLEIGNMMKGGKIPDANQRIYFAEGLCQKIVNHTMSARYLFHGYQLRNDNYVFEPEVDFASIAILTRAALETYLTMNYIFIAGNNEEQKQFRFLCWDLAAFLERSEFDANDERQIKLQRSEKEESERLKVELSSNTLFNSLSKGNQKRALSGQWRLDNYWSDLAVQAGFNEKYFVQQYGFLCAYAHSSRLSVIQIQQNKGIESQREMAKSFIGTLMIVLAKNMYDYMGIMPPLNDMQNDTNKYPVIHSWKYVGEHI